MSFIAANPVFSALVIQGVTSVGTYLVCEKLRDRFIAWQFSLQPRNSDLKGLGLAWGIPLTTISIVGSVALGFLAGIMPTTWIVRGTSLTPMPITKACAGMAAVIFGCLTYRAIDRA